MFNVVRVFTVYMSAYVYLNVCENQVKPCDMNFKVEVK